MKGIQKVRRPKRRDDPIALLVFAEGESSASRQMWSTWLGDKPSRTFMSRGTALQDMVELLETALVDQRFEHFMLVGQRTFPLHSKALFRRGSSYISGWGSSDTTCQGTAMSRALDQWQLSHSGPNWWVQTFAHRDPDAAAAPELSEAETERWWYNAIRSSEDPPAALPYFYTFSQIQPHSQWMVLSRTAAEAIVGQKSQIYTMAADYDSLMAGLRTIKSREHWLTCNADFEHFTAEEMVIGTFLQTVGDAAGVVTRRQVFGERIEEASAPILCAS